MTKEEYTAFINEKKAEGLKVITNPGQTERLRDRIMQKIARAFEITSLTFKDDGKVLVGLITVSPSRQYSDLIIEEDAVVLTTEGWARKVKRYCDQLLNVEIEGEPSFTILDNEIYKIGNGIDTRFAASRTKTIKLTDPETGNEHEEELEEYYNVLTGENIGLSEIINEDTNEYLDNVIVYNMKGIGAQTCTNGQMKKGNITLVAGNRKGFDPVESWNRVTYGAAYLLEDSDHEVTPKEIAQANARLSAYKAPSVPFKAIDTAVVYIGKLTYGMIPSGNEYKDGSGWISAEFVAEGLNEMFSDEYYFTTSAVDGIGFQVRPWTAKIFAEVVRRNYITEFISSCNKGMAILERGKITEEDVEQFALGIKSKGKKGKFADKFVVICNDKSRCWDYDFFTDLNGMKAPYDPDTVSNLEILDMTHTEHNINTGANTSSQMITSLMIADPEATFTFIENLAYRCLEEKRDKLMCDEGKPVSWAELKDPYADKQQILGRVFPKFAREYYAPLWHTLVDKTLEGYVTRINRLNLPIKGAYTKVISDCAADFGIKILDTDGEFVEVVAPVASKHKITEAAGIKYPKQGINEYLKCKIISEKEYCERVTNSTALTDQQKKVLVDHVKHLSGGFLMIPAIEVLKNLLAGCDFDGDGVILFFEQEMLNIIFKITPKAVIIDEKDVTIHDAYEEALG